METWTRIGVPCFDDPTVVEALDLLPGGVAIWDAEARPRSVNQAGADIWGVRRAPDGGSPAPSVVPDDDLADAEHPAVSLLRGRLAEGAHSYAVRRPEGDTVFLRSRLRGLRDARGALVAVAESFDAAEAPRAAPSSDRWQRAYGEVADILPLIMWSADRDGRTTSCNRRFWDYAGLPRATSRPDWTACVHPDDRLRARTMWGQSIAAGSVLCCELRMRRFDGSHHWFQAKAWPVRGPDGSVSRWLGTCTHVDDLKRLELELRRCNEELASFASVASHDLQEPLRMVANFLELLRKRSGGVLDATSIEYLGFAHDGARRMQDLIRKLLDYSRIGRAPLPSTPVDTNAVAREVALNLDRAISDAGGSVRIDPLPAVRVQRVQLTQLLQNLVANALKYRAAAPPVVELSGVREGGECRFSVRDNGIGIAAEDQQRIFDLFQRVHSDGEYAGSGIGLAVCKKIVENHGGRIWVESERGHGSCFRFTLPG